MSLPNHMEAANGLPCIDTHIDWILFPSAVDLHSLQGLHPLFCAAALMSAWYSPSGMTEPCF